MLPSTPGIPAEVRISRKAAGVVLAFLGIIIGFVSVWYAAWSVLLLLAIVLPLAVVTYRGVSNDSNISIARGYVFVYPKNMNTGGLEFWFESICKPKKVKVEGDEVLVSSGGSQLRIVFENEGTKEFFVSEVSGLVKH